MATAAHQQRRARSAQPQGCTNLKLKQASRLVARHYETHVAPTGLRNHGAAEPASARSPSSGSPTTTSRTTLARPS